VSMTWVVSTVGFCLALMLCCTDVAAQGGDENAVNLSANVFGIANAGTAVGGGGIDTSGDAYPEDQLGAFLVWQGSTFTFAPPGPASAVTGKVLALPPGNYASLNLLATAVVKTQQNQSFIVTYTDGTSSTFKQSLSDWHSPVGYSGESVVKMMPYKIIQNGNKSNSTSAPYNLYGYSFPLDSTKVVETLTLPGNRDVVVLAADLIQDTSIQVDLRTVYNLFGIDTPGTVVTGGGMDGSGNAYPADQLGSSVTFSGETFALGTAGPESAVEGKVIPLPQGRYGSLSLLGTGVSGNQTNQSFAVTYSDGTRKVFNLNLSDWHSPQGYQGESLAKSVPYKILQNGSKFNSSSAPYNLYGYTLTLDDTRAATSLTLPANKNVVVLAVDVAPAKFRSNSTSVPLGAADNVFGIDNPGVPVTNGGADGMGFAYAADLLGPSLNWSGKTFLFGTAGVTSAAANTSVSLPAGHYVSLSLLATAVDGNQLNQTFTVTYTDGSTTSFTQSLSDWSFAAFQGPFPNESIAKITDYRIAPNGSKDLNEFNLYGYTFNLDLLKTVKSLTLPTNKHVVVLAIDLSVGPEATAEEPAITPATGAYTSSPFIHIENGQTPGAIIHYTTNGQTPTFSSPVFTHDFQLAGGPGVVVSTTVEAITVANGFTNSPVVSAKYTVGTLPTAAPVFAPVPGLYQSVESATKPPTSPPITLSDSTLGAQIYFTLDGTQPTESLPLLYSKPFTIKPGAVDFVTALAVAQGLGPTTVGVAYQIANPPSDFYGGGNTFLRNLYGSIPGCVYYQNIGAPKVPAGTPLPAVTCSSTGALTGALTGGPTLRQWEASRFNLINESGVKTHAAQFVNLYDLNLTRDHHAIFGTNNFTHAAESAAYVCNHPGPDFYHGLQQGATDAIKTAQINAAIDSLQDPSTLVACVTMDYGINYDTNGKALNGGKPFLRFMVFDANGNLVPAIDLDTRGAKAVPNACSACHGIPFLGDNVTIDQGGFQVPNGGRYIPFDEANMAFSTKPGLTQADQDLEIRALNNMVQFGAGVPSTPISDLINAWNNSPSSPAQPKNFVPITLTGASSVEQQVYYEVWGKVCRSCHVANGVQAEWGGASQVRELEATLPGDMFTFFDLDEVNVCNIDGEHKAIEIMPNARTSFDRLWSSHVGVGPTATLQFDLINLLSDYFQQFTPGLTCVTPAFPNPLTTTNH
jgi:hypothetical protein